MAKVQFSNGFNTAEAIHNAKLYVARQNSVS
ncbi:hypothetical protein COLO4_07667 [Corchorus olitorius]|uniref:Uncharacterized protein n=1 Tax=Corchorus olitorius TaxID=93759 RepID=A0A1R3KIZ9_9ROSI|nr:hypothetical protein COLO4_07667 [Corchorus olitorius]